MNELTHKQKVESFNERYNTGSPDLRFYYLVTFYPGSISRYIRDHDIGLEPTKKEIEDWEKRFK